MAAARAPGCPSSPPLPVAGGAGNVRREFGPAHAGAVEGRCVGIAQVARQVAIGCPVLVSRARASDVAPDCVLYRESPSLPRDGGAGCGDMAAGARHPPARLSGSACAKQVADPEYGLAVASIQHADLARSAFEEGRSALPRRDQVERDWPLNCAQQDFAVERRRVLGVNQCIVRGMGRRGGKSNASRPGQTRPANQQARPYSRTCTTRGERGRGRRKARPTAGSR